MQYAIIQKGQVVNVVEWDGNEGEAAEGQADWKPFSKIAWPKSSVVPIPAGMPVSSGWGYVGGEFLPAQTPVAPVQVPQRVTMRQARLALLAAGKYDAVQAAIAAVPGDQGAAARIEWEFASDVERESAIVTMLAAALKLKPADLDNLFTTAAGL